MGILLVGECRKSQNNMREANALDGRARPSLAALEMGFVIKRF
jgi:hypothetical protein